MTVSFGDAKNSVELLKLTEVIKIPLNWIKFKFGKYRDLTGEWLYKGETVACHHTLDGFTQKGKVFILQSGKDDFKALGHIENTLHNKKVRAKVAIDIPDLKFMKDKKNFLFGKAKIAFRSIHKENEKDYPKSDDSYAVDLKLISQNKMEGTYEVREGDNIGGTVNITLER